MSIPTSRTKGLRRRLLRLGAFRPVSRTVLIGRDRIVPITVPHAGWFCLHKLALYSLRTGTDNPKRDRGHGQPLRKRVKRGAQRALPYLADDHLEAAEVMETLA